MKLFFKDADQAFFPRGLRNAICARIDPEIDHHLMSKWLYEKLGFKLDDLEETSQQRPDIGGYLGTRLLYFTSDCFPASSEETRFIIVDSLDNDEVIVLCQIRGVRASEGVTEALVFVVQPPKRSPGMFSPCLRVQPFLISETQQKRNVSTKRMRLDIKPKSNKLLGSRSRSRRRNARRRGRLLVTKATRTAAKTVQAVKQQSPRRTESDQPEVWPMRVNYTSTLHSKLYMCR